MLFPRYPYKIGELRDVGLYFVRLTICRITCAYIIIDTASSTLTLRSSQFYGFVHTVPYIVVFFHSLYNYICIFLFLFPPILFSPFHDIFAFPLLSYCYIVFMKWKYRTKIEHYRSARGVGFTCSKLSR